MEDPFQDEDLNDLDWTRMILGTRVQVYNVELSRDLGYGTYMGPAHIQMGSVGRPKTNPLLEPDETSEDGEAAATILLKRIFPKATDAAIARMVRRLMAKGYADTPKILLDSGETVFGFECWWQRIDEDAKPTLN